MSVTHPAELWLCAAVVATGGLLMLRSTRDVFQVGRATVIELLAVALVAVVASGRRGAMRWPARTQAVVLGAFAAAVVLASVTARTVGLGLFGPYGRQTGGAMYLAGIVLFLAAAGLRRAGVERLVAVLAGVATLVIAYGVLQALGGDPLTWSGYDLSTKFSTMGQVNFAAGYVGVVTPVVLFVALRRSVPTWLRVGAGVVVVGGVYYAAQTHSFQGLVAVVVGVVPLGVLSLRDPWRRQEPGRRRLLVVGGVLAAAVLGLLTYGFLHDQITSGLDERRYFWRAALGMVKDHPVLGFGFGGFADHFLQYRAAGHAVKYGYSTADAPHSVPLDMLVNGGVVLFLAYAAFVAATARELVRAWRRRGDLLVAAVGGAWLAYLAQSFVSFDVPPLLSLHWLLAGMVVALARADADEPLTLARPSGRNRSRNRQPTFDWVPVGAAAAAVAVLAWPVSGPLRADLISHRSDGRAATGDLAGAAADAHRASELASYVGQYAAQEANIQVHLNDPAAAEAAGQRAVEAAPGFVQYALTLGQLQLSVGKPEEAVRTFHGVVVTDPRDAAIQATIGSLLLKGSRPADAIGFLRRSIELHPVATTWTDLAAAYQATGDQAKADDATTEAARLSG
jgi:O-antigen ligase/Flp pilus assembly protein TadD